LCEREKTKKETNKERIK